MTEDGYYFVKRIGGTETILVALNKECVAYIGGGSVRGEIMRVSDDGYVYKIIIEPDIPDRKRIKCSWEEIYALVCEHCASNVELNDMGVNYTPNNPEYRFQHEINKLAGKWTLCKASALRAEIAKKS